MRDTFIEKMKNVFGDDQRRIDHALAVLDYAEQIQAYEGGNMLIVEAAAIFHDIGIHRAQQKYNSSAGKYQEIEGPPLAKEILTEYNLEEDAIEHVCKITANHHSDRNINTLEFKIIWDADWIVNIPENFPDIDQNGLKHLINKVFKTNKGRQIAENLYLKAAL